MVLIRIRNSVVPAAHYFVGGISVNKLGQVINESNGEVIKDYMQSEK